MGTDALELFFIDATQYYVAGRHAILAWLNPVAGNLLHHAVEMYLKGALSRTMTLDELRKFNHNLPKLWEAVKVRAGDPSLARFGVLLSSLHAFEELRYPDSILARGMEVTMGVSRGATAPSAGTAAKPVRAYELYLEEVDAFVASMFDVAAVNPAFFKSGLTKRARDSLREGNTQPWAG